MGSSFACLSQKANPLVDEAESLILADQPNQREKFETQKMLPPQEFQHGGWNMQCLTYMGERTKVIIFK
jgi:hypothetical protein